MKNLILFFAFVFMITIKINAQSFCNSVLNVERAKEISNLLKTNTRNYDGTRPMIRLALHRITRNDGTGGFTWNEIRNWVGTLPNAYANHNICFTVVNENDIANDNFFNLTSFYGNQTWNDLVSVDRINNAINIYFVEGADAGGIATGFLFNQDPNLPTIFPTVTISRNAGATNIFNTLVLAHEIGHCLGLLHPHETAICEENIPRNNCVQCGDELCDTPADPNLNVSTSNVGENTCAYIGGQTQNGIPYAPDTRNIMSYTLPNCMLWFTEGQGQRMRNFILNTNNFDPFVIPFDRNINGTFSNDDLYFSVENDIQSPTGILTTQISGGSAIYEAGNAIYLNPGFETTNSAFFEARIGQYPCNQPLEINSAKHQEITGDANTQESSISQSLNIYPNPTSQKLNIEYSLKENEKAEITIFDAIGNIVFNKIVNYSQVLEADVSLFSSGMYLLRFQTEGYKQFKRFVISK